MLQTAETLVDRFMDTAVLGHVQQRLPDNDNWTKETWWIQWNEDGIYNDFVLCFLVVSEI